MAFNPKKFLTTPEEYIDKYSTEFNVDSDFVKRMMKQESGGKQYAKSNVGASGYLQLMPATAKEMGVTDIFDKEQNIMGGVKYISKQLKEFGGNKRKALAAYNAGSKWVKRAEAAAGDDWEKHMATADGRKPEYQKQTADYINRIMGDSRLNTASPKPFNPKAFLGRETAEAPTTFNPKAFLGQEVIEPPPEPMVEDLSAPIPEPIDAPIPEPMPEPEIFTPSAPAETTATVTPEILPDPTDKAKAYEEKAKGFTEYRKENFDFIPQQPEEFELKEFQKNILPTLEKAVKAENDKRVADLMKQEAEIKAGPDGILKDEKLRSIDEEIWMPESSLKQEDIRKAIEQDPTFWENYKKSREGKGRESEKLIRLDEAMGQIVSPLSKASQIARTAGQALTFGIDEDAPTMQAKAGSRMEETMGNLMAAYEGTEDPTVKEAFSSMWKEMKEDPVKSARKFTAGFIEQIPALIVTRKFTPSFIKNFSAAKGAGKTVKAATTIGREAAEEGVEFATLDALQKYSQGGQATEADLAMAAAGGVAIGAPVGAAKALKSELKAKPDRPPPIGEIEMEFEDADISTAITPEPIPAKAPDIEPDKVLSKIPDKPVEGVEVPPIVKPPEVKPSDGAPGKRKQEFNLKRGAEEFLTPISTRIRRISPEILYRVRKVDFSTANAIHKNVEAAKPFVEAIKATKKTGGYNELDLALKNSDIKSVDKLMPDQKKAAVEFRKMMDDTHTRAREAGLEAGYVENHFPRQVIDYEGLIKHLKKTDKYGPVEKAVADKTKVKKRPLTEDETADVINSYLKGYKPKGTGKLGSLKARSIEKITPEMNKFYAPMDESIGTYIQGMNKAIEASKFFGNKLIKDEDGKVDLTESIGSYVSGKDLSSTQQLELQSMLEAYFRPGKPGELTSLFKNIGYVTTMGSPTSAITQIGDLAFSMQHAGVFNTLKTVVSKKEVKLDEVGVHNMAHEFAEPSKSAKAVQAVFKGTGLTLMDKLGKETLINSHLKKIRKQAKAEYAPLSRELKTMFGDRSTQVLADLKTSKVTDDTRLLLFNRLADQTPITATEYPEAYLRAKKGKLFYMLKSYTVKALDVQRRALFEDIEGAKTKTEKAHAVGRLARLAGALFATGMAATAIKDVMMGRDLNVEDMTEDNLWKMAGLSKYQAWQFREEPTKEALAKMVLPPSKIYEAMYDDMEAAIKDKKYNPLKGETVGSVPFIGKLWYWWFGAGVEKRIKRKDRTDWEDLPDLKREAKEDPKLRGKAQRGIKLKRRWNELKKRREASTSSKAKKRYQKQMDKLTERFEKSTEG